MLLHSGGHQSSISDYTAIVVENYPSDSRMKIREDGVCQTARSRMGTGGGNVPLVIQIKDEAEDSDEP